jgi:diacylglycerol kinase family enzyme
MDIPPPSPVARPLPTFVNARAGSADEAGDALSDASRFDVRQIEPERLADEIRQAVDGGASRVLVAGGDGTIAAAAAVVAGTPVELALLPGGTLNHFTRDLGLPIEPAEAAAIATGGRPVEVDVGYVNDRLFLNTSSVGAYVLFVRTRERLERYLGYRLASLVAALRILSGLRSYRVELEVDGALRSYKTPLVFIGVGERDLQLPALGSRVPDGRRGLHVLVVRGRTRARVVAIALAAAARGVQHVSRTPLLDSFLVDYCRIEMPRRRGNVAVDGEIVPMEAPLEYRLARGALRVVVPESREEGRGRREE